MFSVLHIRRSTIFWITAFAQQYYELLTRQVAGYKVTWKEQDGHSSPSKCDTLVIHLVEITPTLEEEVLVAITVFITTGRIQVRGKGIEDWNTHEFPVLLECVNKLSDIKHFAVNRLALKELHFNPVVQERSKEE